MRYRQVIAVVIVLLIVLSITGCQKEVLRNTPSISTTVSLNTAAETSLGTIIETEYGYYYSTFGGLLYADKSDLQNWVIVCNDPACDHVLSKCSAKVFGGVFGQNNRLFTLRSTEDMESMVLNEQLGFAMCSMAMDGTDQQVEHFIEETQGVHQGSYFSAITNGKGSFLCGASILQADGIFKNILLSATDRSVLVLAQNYSEDQSNEVLDVETSIRGDTVLYTDVLAPQGETYQHMYRVKDGKIEEVMGLAGHNPQCGYLSGDYLYHYILSDGYYKTQISTGASQKRMDAQLKNGIAYHLTEQYIVEHNLLYEYVPEEPQILIYNGKQWIDVEIPENFGHKGEATVFPLALTTEHIFFQLFSGGKNCLYVVNHTNSNPTLTLCGQF